MADTKTMIITAYGQTDQGLVRKENEDNLLVDKEKHVYAVADGLGGLPGGAKASEMTVQKLGELISESKSGEKIKFPNYFEVINDGVTAESQNLFGEDLGMATTLTVAQIIGNRLYIGHVGDTGIFLFRDGKCEQITKDHTMAEEIRDRMQPGDDTYIPEYYNHTLTRCIGHTETLVTDVYDIELMNEDRLLIYSDGVTKTWSEDELTEEMQSAESPEDYVKLLIKKGNERGGPDNITAIALFVTG